MAAFERLSGIIIQPIWAALDEDGNVMGERAEQPPTKIYFPYAESLLEYLRAKENELMQKRREEAVAREAPSELRYPLPGGSPRLD